VLNGTCRIGIIGSLPTIPDELHSEPLLDVPFVTVVSAEHPLARARGTISKAAVAKHVQLVLTDRTALSEGRNFGVLSPLTWRLADLGAKHAFLLAGFGWCHMPVHMIEEDLKKEAPDHQGGGLQSKDRLPGHARESEKGEFLVRKHTMISSSGATPPRAMPGSGMRRAGMAATTTRCG
jgi:DNA-binding transcriptional LysR family regulator